jgi:hypothetical protein
LTLAVMVFQLTFIRRFPSKSTRSAVQSEKLLISSIRVCPVTHIPDKRDCFMESGCELEIQMRAGYGGPAV